MISSGGIHSIDDFQHQAESYQFNAGFFVDRESLLQGEMAKVVVRAGLRLNGEPIGLSAIDNPILQVRSTDQDGVDSTQTIDDFKLSEHQESIHEFRVPPRLSTITFTISGKIKSSLNRTMNRRSVLRSRFQ